MVVLVTKINTVSFVLFHVEHLEAVEWFWRWRIVGPYPDAYLSWRSGSSSLSYVPLHSEIPHCQIDAEWRASEDEAWGKVALHEARAGRASFRVKAFEDFLMPDGFNAVAALRGHVACYAFGPLDLRAGIETTIEGVAVGPFTQNILLQDGEFKPVIANLSLENVGPSIGSLVPCPMNKPILSKSHDPGARRLFVIGSKADRQPL